MVRWRKSLALRLNGYGFVASHAPGTATALGFRLAPRQGWLYWLWVSAAIGAILLIVPLIAGLVFPGLSLGRPAAPTWDRLLSGCLIAPVFEEEVVHEAADRGAPAPFHLQDGQRPPGGGLRTGYHQLL